MGYWEGMDLPIMAGDVQVRFGIELASVLPTSVIKATMDLTAQDQDGEDLVCVKGTLSAGVEEEKPKLEVSKSLAFSWEDCGDASTHAFTTDVQPTTIPLGERATLVGTGACDKDIENGAFQMKVSAGPAKQTFQGFIGQPSTFDFPLGVGTLYWEGMDLPIMAGDVQVKFGI